jgi:hypothetical protein
LPVGQESHTGVEGPRDRVSQVCAAADDRLRTCRSDTAGIPRGDVFRAKAPDLT